MNWLASEPCRSRHLFRLRLKLAAAALGRFGLDEGATFEVGRATRNSVDGTVPVDPFAGDGISALAEAGERCPGSVRQPSRCFSQVWDGRAFGPLQEVNDPR